MRNRLVILVVAITTIAALVACSTSGLLASRSEPTATPTKTPKPTFTATATPTNTPLPTDTPTPTPTATNTPEPTATFTPLPTDTPTNTPVPPTATKKPAAPRPRPTNTPKPQAPAPTAAPQYAMSKVDQRNWPNCGSTGIKSFFKKRDGGIYPGLQFAVYAGGKCVGLSAWANEVDGSADFILWPNGPRPGSWEVVVVETTDGTSGEPGCGKITKTLSARVAFQTVDKPCDSDSTGVQWVWFTFKQN